MSQDLEESPYIKTTTHNYVSRKAMIAGAKQVELKGRSIVQEGVKVRGDLARVRIGRYCRIETGSLLEPPLSQKQRVPQVIGSHTYIGEDCQIHAAAIGSLVWIGNNVRLGKRVIVKDNCVIEDGVILGDDTVIPPFTRVSKSGRHHELPPSMAVQMQEWTLDRYQEFQLQQREVGQ